MIRPQPERAIRVLIAEHSDDDIQALRTILEQWFHDPMEIYATTCASEALTLAQRHAVDLVIANAHLAEGDGLKLCRELRKSPDLGHLPIMLLGAGTSARAKIMGFTSGADDYIVRPIDDRLLVARLRLLLRLKNIDRLQV